MAMIKGKGAKAANQKLREENARLEREKERAQEQALRGNYYPYGNYNEDRKITSLETRLGTTERNLERAEAQCDAQVNRVREKAERQIATITEERDLAVAQTANLITQITNLRDENKYRAQRDELLNKARVRVTQAEERVTVAEEMRDRLTAEYEAEMTRHQEEVRQQMVQLQQEIARLGRELGQIQAQNTCVICLDAQPNIVLFPCLHLSMCNGCFHRHNERSTSCPTCRTEKSGHVQVFRV